MAIIIRAPRATERKLYVFAVILQGTVSQDCCDSNSKKYLCTRAVCQGGSIFNFFANYNMLAIKAIFFYLAEKHSRKTFQVSY